MTKRRRHRSLARIMRQRERALAHWRRRTAKRRVVDMVLDGCPRAEQAHDEDRRNDRGR